ncbi:MAG TPA: outer membrane lipoprotein chaperone LolA [Blastocatellia bacterium]|nr:outer membrane lipoprotein chaperone LolA [Blastocatellia bacterium]
MQSHLPNYTPTSSHQCLIRIRVCLLLALVCLSFAFINSITYSYPINRYQMQGLTLAAPPDARSVTPQVNLAALIDGLQSKYGRMQGMAADFTQIYLGADGRRASEAGYLVLKRPSKARWEYTQPERKLFISDGRNIFFYVYGERQATQASVKESADPQIPFLFLLGRGNLRRDFSRIEVAAGAHAAAAGNVVLLLVPKRAPQEFKQLLVEVSPSSLAVHRMVIFERNGGRMDFSLANVRENFIAPDSDFHFTSPPGVTLKRAQ